jgi:hypothetical protein
VNAGEECDIGVYRKGGGGGVSRLSSRDGSDDGDSASVMFGSTSVCTVVEIISAAIAGSLFRLVARSGPVMICVNGVALGPNASANEIKWVDAAP